MKSTLLLRHSAYALLAASLAGAAPAARPAKKSAAPPPERAADIPQRLAKWKPVEMPFRVESLTPRERKMVEKLIDACRDLENLFWRQSGPQDIALYNALAKSPREEDRQLAQLLWINGGRYDQLEENRPFLGRSPAPPGGALYPEGIKRAEIDAYVHAHPAQRQAIFDGRTVVRRSGRRLETIPYHTAYRHWLAPAARKLEQAAALSDEPAFAAYLRLRAKALLTDEYSASDVAWVKLTDPKFDLIFAPYETYLDDLLGVKTSYGAAVLVRDEEESGKLAAFQKFVPEIQDALPLPPEDRPSKRGHAAPMEVMDTPFRAGDLRHGYQAVADNLPNDPRLHQNVGSKRIFFKNFLDARVEYVILPVARRIMVADQAAAVSADGYLAGTLMHEISHDLGPAFARKDGKRIDIREAIGPAFSGLEEAKADATGMFALAWLMDRGILPRERSREYYVSYAAGLLRTVRFGAGESHARAEMMEINYLLEQGAILREPASGRYAIDLAKMPAAIASLARELLETEAAGDRARAEGWFQKYETMLPDLKAALDAAADIPVDIDPRGSFPEGVR